MARSRLFHAIVMVGTSLVSAESCTLSTSENSSQDVASEQVRATPDVASFGTDAGSTQDVSVDNQTVFLAQDVQLRDANIQDINVQDTNIQDVNIRDTNIEDINTQRDSNLLAVEDAFADARDVNEADLSDVGWHPTK